MNLAFIQAPAWGRDCPPHTMCYLSGLIRSKGHKAYLFDLNNALYHTSSRYLRKMWDDKDCYHFWEKRELVDSLLDENKKLIDFYIEKILRTNSRIIGFTVHFSSVWASLAIAKRIKEQDKNRIIVFGGPDCSRQQKGDYLITRDCVDIVVHGEGEGPLSEIIDIVEKTNDSKGIKGCLLLRDGQIIDGGYAPGPKNLDDLPIPDYSDFGEEINARMYREPNRLDISDSRGCVSCCHFCSEWQFWGKFRAKSGKRIYEEITQYIQNFPQVNHFYFIGSLINGDMQALDAFCDLVIAGRLEITWAAQAIIRPEMTRAFLKKMKLAGCTWISYGMESGSERVLNKMNKKFSLAAASNVLEAAKDAGIAVQVNFMFGLPTETRDDFNQTLRFLTDNRRYFDSILASQSFCVIDKGTYLYNHPEEFGIKGRKHHLYWESNAGQNTYPERFNRYEEFCRKALSLDIPETSGVLKIKPDKWQLLGDYFFYKRDYAQAITNYLNAVHNEIATRALFNKLCQCYEATCSLDKAEEILRKSLEIKADINANGLSDESIALKIASLGEIKNCLNKVSAIGNFTSLDSAKLAKILQYFAGINYKHVDLEKILMDFDFDNKQKSMARTLYSHGLWDKLSNYLLIDIQKKRRETVVYGYPYWLVIDPCNYCSLSCPFCPTGQKRSARAKGKLSLETFKSIVEKLGHYLIHIDLVNWGEPFLNEHIFEMVKFAKEYHVDVKIDSNLNHLNEKGATELVLSGLDKIVASIDGITDQTYAKYRVGGNFQLAMDNLKLIVKKRAELKRSKPYVTWQFLVFRHNEHEIREARSLAKRIGVDHIGITKAFIGDKNWIPLTSEYSNYKIENMDSEATFEHFKKSEAPFCSWPWEAIAINPNGSVSPCCSVEEEKDDFGNFFDQPFEDLWNSESYLKARRHIGGGKQALFSQKNICVDCHHQGLINVDILSCHSFFD